MNAMKIYGIDVGEGVTATANVMDVISSTLEKDVCEIFIENLHGKQNVFDNIIENVVSDNVVVTLIADDNASITVYVSQPNKDNNNFTYLSFSIFNAIFRTCILPYASKEKELVISFPDVDIGSLEGIRECKEKNRVGSNRCDYNLKWFLVQTLKNHIMDVHIDTGDANFREEEEIDQKDLNISPTKNFKGMIINETDADMMKRLFKHRLRSGEVENEMICCLNPNHNDNKPSMRVTILPFCWRKSRKISVDKETDKELMDLYYKNEGMGTKFTYIGDNAVRDTRTKRIYILYSVKKLCYSCNFQ